MIEVRDNFLSDLDFRFIKTKIFDDSNFLWQFNSMREHTNSNRKEDKPFQFVHFLYYDFCQTSDYFVYVKPIIKKLKIRALLRIKVNLTTMSQNIIEGDFHVDDEHDHKVAIFYVNSNDGYTLFEDGTKIESVANRIVLFDGSLRHTGTNCTDKQRRVVINFNYL